MERVDCVGQSFCKVAPLPKSSAGNEMKKLKFGIFKSCQCQIHIQSMSRAFGFDRVSSATSKFALYDNLAD